MTINTLDEYLTAIENHLGVKIDHEEVKRVRAKEPKTKMDFAKRLAEEEKLLEKQKKANDEAYKAFIEKNTNKIRELRKK